MTARPRGLCPACDELIPLKASGLLMRHEAAGATCHGSDAEPEERVSESELERRQDPRQLEAEAFDQDAYYDGRGLLWD